MLERHGARAEVAKKMAISKTTLARWLDGENPPDLEQVEELADALGRPAIDLLFPGEMPVAPVPTPDEALAVLRSAIVRTRQEHDMLRLFRLLRSDDAREVWLDNLRTATGREAQDGSGGNFPQDSSGALPGKPDLKR